MDSGQYRSGSPAGESRAPTPVKIVIAGGFGVGKSTLVGAVSEIDPLRTEALVTNESEGVDNLDAVPSKATTTVAMDFGRLTLGEDLIAFRPADGWVYFPSVVEILITAGVSVFRRVEPR